MPTSMPLTLAEERLISTVVETTFADVKPSVIPRTVGRWVNTRRSSTILPTVIEAQRRVILQEDGHRRAGS
jgi:hypothetical protein